MVIQVCGFLIDTQFIYHISEVKCNFSENSGYPYDGYFCNGYFDINFVNQRQISISINGKKNHETMHTNGYRTEERITTAKLNQVRNRLVNIWSNNQSSIPKIDFDETP
jgi:hypothetical protein